MKNFALVGAAGYIAPKHMKAVMETGNQMIAAYDKFDSVGILDSYFPNASFFTEFERFDRFVEKIKGTDQGVDYVSVTSPNYLHDSHIRFGLRVGADVVCEKPLVLNPWNLDGLQNMEKESGRRVFNILQLRLHPTIMALRESIMAEKSNKIHDIDLTYISARGNWYYTSWKGDISKSGGIASNIGIHFFDMLIWIFGKVKTNIVHLQTHDRASGFLELENARVRWFLSINEDTLPESVRAKGKRTYRSLTMEGNEIDFTEGFVDLHTKSYSEIMAGRGFGLDEARASIELVHEIRDESPMGPFGDYHPFAKKPLVTHPFRHQKRK